MDQLPVELLAHIARLIGHKESFRLREVSRYICDVVTPLLFEVISIGWIPEHLDHLKRLANSPVAKHVRGLRINTEVLPLLSWKNWLLAIRDTMVEEHASSIPREWLYSAIHLDEEDLERIVFTKHTELQVSLAYAAFVELNISQHDEGPRMGDRLGSALEKFVHLRRLELHDQRGIVYGDEDEFEQDALALCSPWKASLINPDAYYRSLVDDYSDLEDGAEPGPHVLSSVRALRCIMRSLASNAKYRTRNAVPGIENLVFTIGHHIPISDWYFLGESESDVNDMCFKYEKPPWTMRIFCSLFQHLTCITLRLWTEQFDKYEEVCLEIAHGLSHAVNLRQLELDNRVSECFELFDQIADLEGECPWPRLEQLKLTGKAISKSLAKIVCMSNESLRVLTLEDIAIYGVEEFLTGARWDDFFESIQPSLQLKSASVSHLHDESRRWPRESFEWQGVFFARSGKRKSDVQLAVEDFLVNSVTELSRQEHWDITGPRIKGFTALNELAAADSTWEGVSRLPTWDDS